MRLARAIVALWLLLSPVAAEAKIMVVSVSLNDVSGEVPGNNARMVKLVTNILDMAGTDYRVVQIKDTKVEFMRTGLQTWNFGKDGAFVEQFDGVIHVNWAINASGFPNYRPDSMLKGGSTKAPTVPQLFLSTNSWAIINGDNLNLFSDAASAGRCTTGSTGGFGGLYAGQGSYLASRPTLRAINSTFIEPLLRNPTPPPGGLRVHVGVSAPNLITREPSNGDDHICRWCDSMVVATNGMPDTMVVWERSLSHINGASPVIFAMMGGAGLSNVDSIFNAGGTVRPASEGEVPIAMMALARLDSLTGGSVFPKNKPPIRIALTIDGAFCYNARMHSRGILKSDSSSFDASMDSLATLGIPVTFGVNVDSIDNYPEWKRWLAKVPKARFSPQTWNGVLDTNYKATPSFDNPIDITGRFRRRAAMGDTTTHLGGDSTIYKMLLGGRFICNREWPGRASRFLMAPEDDWTPRGMNAKGVEPGIDSLIFAINRAGFDGIRVNGHDPDHRASYRPDDPRGWWNEQGWAYGVRGSRIKLLAYPGHGIAGGVVHFARADSTPPIASLFGMIFQDINRAWLGATQKQDWNYDTWPYDDCSGGCPRTWDGVWLNQKDRVWREHYRGSIMRFGASDFSGDPSRTARRGWWAVKSVANQITMINSLAGRTIIEFAYPEDINP